MSELNKYLIISIHSIQSRFYIFCSHGIYIFDVNFIQFTPILLFPSVCTKFISPLPYNGHIYILDNLKNIRIFNLKSLRFCAKTKYRRRYVTFGDVDVYKVINYNLLCQVYSPESNHYFPIDVFDLNIKIDHLFIGRDKLKNFVCKLKKFRMHLAEYPCLLPCGNIACFKCIKETCDKNTNLFYCSAETCNIVHRISSNSDIKLVPFTQNDLRSICEIQLDFKSESDDLGKLCDVVIFVVSFKILCFYLK